MHLLVFSAFPRQRRMALDIGRHVSMHLLVLSAFRLGMRDAHFDKLNMSQCTFWCSVLSDAAMPDSSSARTGQSQCTFWCSVLSDMDITASIYNSARDVSMHLLVLSAFRQLSIWRLTILINMSQCTFWCSVLSDSRSARSRRSSSCCLNAPSGAQCFPTGFVVGGSVFDARRSQCTFWCSVLSDASGGAGGAFMGFASQCTFWCSVLSDTESTLSPLPGRLSQCTFWCSVLSDLPKCRLS